MKGIQPWPLGIAVVFVLFVSLQIGLIATVSHGFEGPDDVQYYRHGLEFSRQVAQQRRQETLGWQFSSNVGERIPSEFTMQVAVRDRDGRVFPDARVAIELGRPATRRDDARFALLRSRATGDHFALPLTLTPGTWEIKVTVRAAGETYVKKLRTRVDGKA